MLTPIENLPKHIFGVKAVGDVTADDLKNVLHPGLEALVKDFDEIYYLLVLETKVENFTAGAWFQDIAAGVEHFTKWKKMAIVTDQKVVESFTNAFSYVSPGQARGFTLAQLNEAIEWLTIKL